MFVLVHFEEHVPLTVLSCEAITAVTGVEKFPFTIVAHTLTEPSPSPAVYNVITKPIAAPR